MQCLYLVKVPYIIEKEDGNIYDTWETVIPYHLWLKNNGIKRFRGGGFARRDVKIDDIRFATFRFENEEDAMAFKMRWM